MKKNVIISGYYGFKNFGDEAILSLLISKLQEHNVTIITSDSDYTKSLYNNVSTVYTFDILNIVKSIFKSDILISGGGSLLQDVTGIKSLFYYLFVIFSALFFRKKVLIFAQGIGPINSAIGQFFTKLILKHCDYISVRDSNSFNTLKSWGINSILVNDPIFSIPINSENSTNEVAIQLRNFKTMNEDFIQRLALKVNTMFKTHPIRIYSFQDSIDLPVCESLKKSLTILNPDIDVKILSNLNLNEVIDGISKSKYLIGMRFHSLIISLLAGVKTIAINYDIKVKQLATEFGIPMVNLSDDFGNKFEIIDTLDENTLKEKAKAKLFDWTDFNSILNGN